MGTDYGNFNKSDMGAQAAWKGFSSQTLYIASRLMSAPDEYLFCPEDIEDLVVKKDDAVIEAVQVKNISSDLTLSSLASTKSSKGGEGFFKRVCYLHAHYPDFSLVRVIYFQELGEELLQFIQGKKTAKETMLKKLIANHELEETEAAWLLSSLVFEKVSIDDLQANINAQISQYVEVMAAPNIAQALLTQYISELSNNKGTTSLEQWKEKMCQIGTDLAAIDGYYKEYQKSLVRLCDLTSSLDTNSLHLEFMQGISTKPAHIRNNFDFPREYWESVITEMVSQNKSTIIKGVSGQGKSALCYRYLMNHYPEDLVFCVRSISSEQQAENLVAALKGIAKHTQNIITYIDVNPGEYQWIYLLQELQARGISIPVLISIRDEDFNMTPIRNNSVRIEVVEIELTQQEARQLYNQYTETLPHPQFRSFEEAWGAFGETGPLIEFIYLLTHNQTLTQRLQSQVDSLLREKVPDTWLELLQIVCYSGRMGCPVKAATLKNEINCDTFSAAKKRLSDEYLIKSTEDGEYIEALHPQRAKLLLEILNHELTKNSLKSLLTSLKCTHGKYAQILAMDYFTTYPYCLEDIKTISIENFSEWYSLAGLLKTMLWLDVKRYVEENIIVINGLVEKRGAGWLPFLPLDISGLIRPNEIIIESLVSTLTEGNLSINKEELLEAIDSVKNGLSSLQIDYQATDCFVNLCKMPTNNPQSDSEWSAFGYSLFWCAMRKKNIDVSHCFDTIGECLQSGDSQLMANAIRGMREHCDSKALYDDVVSVLMQKIKQEYCMVYFFESETEVKCKFVPPIFAENQGDAATKNFNHYWKIKLLDILQQLYPDKEYIDIEVIGTDLLSELGIEVMDNKVRIPKENRHLDWITEINAWEKSRIDYLYRPENWNEYVNEIDRLRLTANSFVVDLILCLDDFYKKRRFNQSRWSKVVADIELYKSISFHSLLLPKSTVDSYCLYREDMQTTNTFKTEVGTLALQSLSYEKYVVLRKSFNETFTGLENFFNQFASVLLARVNQQEVSNLDQLRLSRYNLFDSSKKILVFQQEYEKVFRRYSTLERSFQKEELENRIILLNMWTYICGCAPKGYAITYDAKQRYRKSSNTIQELIKTIPEYIDVKCIECNHSVYLVREFDPSSGVTLEDDYEKVMINLQKHFEIAFPFMSERWYLETHDPILTYLPVFNGIPLAAGFMIPLYRLLNSDKSGMISALLPVEISEEVENLVMHRNQILRDWKVAYSNLAAIRVMMLQYNSVITKLDETYICDIGMVQYIISFCDKLSKIVEGFSASFSLILEPLNSDSNELAQALVAEFPALLGYLMTIDEVISKCEPVDENIIELANNIVAVMILLQSDFIGE